MQGGFTRALADKQRRIPANRQRITPNVDAWHPTTNRSSEDNERILTSGEVDMDVSKRTGMGPIDRTAKTSMAYALRYLKLAWLGAMKMPTRSYMNLKDD